MVTQVYSLCIGNKDCSAERTQYVYETLEDAIQEARERNLRFYNRSLIDINDAWAQWHQTDGADISELLTASLVSAEAREIAEAAKNRLGKNYSIREIIDMVISDCMEYSVLPFNWWGVSEAKFIKAEEDKV